MAQYSNFFCLHGHIDKKAHKIPNIQCRKEGSSKNLLKILLFLYRNDDYDSNISPFYEHLLRARHCCKHFT